MLSQEFQAPRHQPRAVDAGPGMLGPQVGKILVGSRRYRPLVGCTGCRGWLSQAEFEDVWQKVKGCC